MKPVISNAISLENHNYIPDMLPLISELKDVIPKADDDSMILIEGVENALKEIEQEKSPEIVKNSKAMKRIKSVLEKVNDGNDKFSQVVQGSGKAIESIQKLAGQYNKVAEWCGFPQVPSVFTKK